MTAFMLPTTHPAELIVRELAAEHGIVDIDDLHHLGLELIRRRCEREAWIRQLENERQVMLTLRIPTLEGRLRQAELDRNEWFARATSAEKRIVIAMGGIVLLGVVAVASLAAIGMAIA